MSQRMPILFGLALAGVASAGVPTTVQHQGRLLDAAGGPLNGVLPIEVRLWNAGAGGSQVWMEPFAAVRVDDGYYSLILGNSAPLDADLLDDPLWIEVSVDGRAVGRTPLASAPSAIVAQSVRGGVVDASELRVNGEPVVGNDGVLLAVPSGAVMFFDLGACPDGWTALTEARGRTIVGASSPGGVGSMVGTALEDRGQRVITDVPAHQHAVNPPPTDSTLAGRHSHTVDPAAVNSSSGGGHVHSIDPPNTGTNTTGNHNHTVDPSAVNASSVGNHTHAVDPPNTSTTSDTHNHSYQDIYWSENGGPSSSPTGNHAGSDEGYDTDNEHWQFNRTTGSDTHNHTVNIGSFTSGGAGSHNHTVDVGATTSTTAGNHAHSVDIGAFNSGNAGAHNHSVDIPSTTSSTQSDHGHTVDIGNFNSASTGQASVDVTMPYLQLLACRRE